MTPPPDPRAVAQAIVARCRHTAPAVHPLDESGACADCIATALTDATQTVEHRLVQALDAALFGYATARPESPNQRWTALLREVSALADATRMLDAENDRLKAHAKALFDENKSAAIRVGALEGALSNIKPLVTGQLPTPIPYAMVQRCLVIADTVDAALAPPAPTEEP